MSTQISRSDADLLGTSDTPVSTAPGAVEAIATTESPARSAGNRPPIPDASTPSPEPSDAAPKEAKPAKPARKPRTRRRAPVWKWDAPSWGVSLMVHIAVLVALGLMAVGGQIEPLAGSIDAGTEDTSRAEEDLTALYAEPSADERELAVGDPTSMLAPGAPSATPAIRTATAEVSETRSLAGMIDIAVPTPSTSLIPSTGTLNRDLSGGRRISGETGRPTDGYGEALDQLAREILAHLATSRVTVLWMFDESGSMKDDQRMIRDKFDRVISELRIQVPSDRREAGDLEHAIIGFGETIHYEDSRPRADLEDIRQAIDGLRVDESGVERTMKAGFEALARYSRIIEKDRKVLMVLITDESGDDGDLVEQARLAMVNRGVTAYVLGRQSMFGYDTVRLRYQDPVTGDIYWPTIARGPETAGLEMLQWDGLWKDRHDEQPSGFAPYELARLVKDTGGIFFLLPNEEELRNRPGGEKAYPFETLKEYSPDYSPRADYASRVAQSDLRRTMNEIIQLTQKDFGFERHFPVNPPELGQKIAQELPKVEIQLRALREIETRLRAMEPARDKEVNRRWQANYDLMLAQVVAFQIKAYEYRACLAEMVSLANQGKLKPKNPPIPNQRRTDWVINHSGKKKAPTEETEKRYAEATQLLNEVIERHPDTPWADLAQLTLNRGLGCDWSEWSVHPDYNKRAALVPKY
ncbi:vWA domain-containing protein [Tautonia marina]|uniref:vWA domain-containing protein n=1 Tax=Tautonia marina TaxID=2653855 RepID=UPI0012605C19|nr:vWA domain-containing protein [Tautonia marina]